MAGGGKGSKISALIDECSDISPLSDEQRHAAAKLVCANAAGDTHTDQVADAAELMEMLGLLPHQRDDWYLTSLVSPANRDCSTGLS